MNTLVKYKTPSVEKNHTPKGMHPHLIAERIHLTINSANGTFTFESMISQLYALL